MVDLAGFRQINELVEREARFVHALQAEIAEDNHRSGPSRGAGPSVLSLKLVV